MKSITLSILVLLSLQSIETTASGYDIGDKAADFSLKNVDGTMVSLTDYEDAKGFIIIFTCNHCPFAKAYQDRIIALDIKYKAMGYPVVAINPNDPKIVPQDSYEKMIKRADEKAFTFPYLFDQEQTVYKAFGATRTPHAFLLNKNDQDDLIVKYIGAIDDNSQNAKGVKEAYLSKAVDALLSGTDPNPTNTKAIGCSIKDKSK